jgi:undecaprenyl-diphosphatase
VAIWEILLLAVIQGITEFLPISSKTHLLFTQILLDWKDPAQNLTITIMLHAGSLLAILVYYWKTWLSLFQERRSEWIPLLLATLPAGLIGFLLQKQIESLFDSPALAGGMLIGTGIWIFLSEKFGKGKYQNVSDVPYWKILLIGLAQGAALFPGISRSGSTIGAAYLAGFRREDAVRFSFFMGAIIISGALLFRLRSLLANQGTIAPVPIILGILVTFVVSLFAIRVVEILSKKGRMFFFAAYCVGAGLIAFLYFTLGKG